MLSYTRQSVLVSGAERLCVIVRAGRICIMSASRDWDWSVRRVLCTLTPKFAHSRNRVSRAMALSVACVKSTRQDLPLSYPASHDLALAAARCFVLTH